MLMLNGTVAAVLMGGPYAGTRGEVIRTPSGTPRHELRFGEQGGFLYRLDAKRSTDELAVYRFDENGSPAVILAKMNGTWD